MKPMKYILISILILSSGIISAHKDFWTSKDFGNINVTIKTGFNYEEINKVFIIGELAENLSKKLNYTNPIILNFYHHYVGDCNSAYFISCDKVEDPLSQNTIFISQGSRKFDIVTTLKLLEYSIKNIGSILTSQKPIKYDKDSFHWDLNSIDTTLIKEQLQKSNSELITNITKLRVLRKETDFKYGLSYCWQNNEFHIISRDFKTQKDTILLSIDNIYDFIKLDNFSALIFDSDHSFYYISNYVQPKISKKQIIIKIKNCYKPFNVNDIGGHKLLITIENLDAKEKQRTLIYLINKDKLIQDLDKLLNNKQ